MAWQLIYTSAPRSLEAGRSGFGTVARHRALSPLLVSAIERTSQFSRLPGVDTDRVISSHRIVTVAGSRFHLLSSIRDAGADYTGRTNHIAHHLIVDPREIAQLGAGGPSPADVLLAMTWATSWSEHPRYLEAADEVALATLHARTTGTAWQRITGDPNQAWLLATGDASRGAYIIQPPDVDLREVFAESLRLMPERLWQISFTTSLQPSDESADFRWIGIEERSPLRAQAESSGRPVLNLASPGTLPLVEVAQPAAASPVQQSFAPISSPNSDEGQTAWPTATSVTTQQPTHAPIERGVEWPSASTPPTTRSNRKWWLLTGAMSIIVAAASVAFFVGRPIYTKYKHRKDVSAEIGTILTRTGFFSGNVIGELQKADAIDIAKELATAGSELVEVARNAEFSGMGVRRPNDEIRRRAKEEHLLLPMEITKLDDNLREIAAIHKKITDFDPKPEGYKAFAELKAHRKEIDGLNLEIFTKIKAQLTLLADQRQEKLLSVLVTGPSGGKLKPSEPVIWFVDALKITKSVSNDEDAKRTQVWIKKWESLERPKNPLESDTFLFDLEKEIANKVNWPEWLLVLAQSKIKDGRPTEPTTANVTGSTEGAPTPTPPAEQVRPPKLYFFKDNEILLCPLPDGAVPLRFFLKSPGNGEKEVIPYGPPPENTMTDLRPLTYERIVYFKRNAGTKGSTLTPATAIPEPPYRLIAKRGDTEIVNIIVGQPPKDEDWLKNASINLKLKPEGQIIGMLPELPPASATFKLQNSGEIDGTGTIYQLTVDSEGKCNYEKPRDAILKQITNLINRSKELQKMKQTSTAANPPKITAKDVGEFAKKAAELQYPIRGNRDKTYQPFISLLSHGKSLAETPQDKPEMIIKHSNALRKESEILQKSNRDDQNLRKILLDCMKLNNEAGDSSAAAELANALKNQQANIDANVSKIDAEMDRLKALSLLKDNKLPAGDYTLFVHPSVIGLAPIKLRTFRIP